MSAWDDEHMRQALADADLSVTVRRWPNEAEADELDLRLAAISAHARGDQAAERQALDALALIERSLL